MEELAAALAKQLPPNAPAPAVEVLKLTFVPTTSPSFPAATPSALQVFPTDLSSPVLSALIISLSFAPTTTLPNPSHCVHLFHVLIWCLLD
jgi:hypothetical protein